MGESFDGRQRVLRNMKRELKDYGGTAYAYVNLIREPDNEHDANAVMVVNDDGRQIGYLPKELAVQYQHALRLWEDVGRSARCQAKLRGGTSEKPSIGVWLDLASPKEIEEIFRSRGRD